MEKMFMYLVGKTWHRKDGRSPQINLYIQRNHNQIPSGIFQRTHKLILKFF